MVPVQTGDPPGAGGGTVVIIVCWKCNEKLGIDGHYDLERRCPVCNAFFYRPGHVPSGIYARTSDLDFRIGDIVKVENATGAWLKVGDTHKVTDVTPVGLILDLDLGPFQQIRFSLVRPAEANLPGNCSSENIKAETTGSRYRTPDQNKTDMQYSTDALSDEPALKQLPMLLDITGSAGDLLKFHINIPESARITGMKVNHSCAARKFFLGGERVWITPTNDSQHPGRWKLPENNWWWYCGPNTKLEVLLQLADIAQAKDFQVTLFYEQTPAKFAKWLADGECVKGRPPDELSEPVTNPPESPSPETTKPSGQVPPETSAHCASPRACYEVLEPGSQYCRGHLYLAGMCTAVWSDGSGHARGCILPRVKASKFCVEHVKQPYVYSCAIHSDPTGKNWDTQRNVKQGTVAKGFGGYPNGMTCSCEDWTTGQRTGRADSSELFVSIENEIAGLIQNPDSAFLLLQGNTAKVARKILSHLAHQHGMKPS